MPQFLSLHPLHGNKVYGWDSPCSSSSHHTGAILRLTESTAATKRDSVHFARINSTCAFLIASYVQLIRSLACSALLSFPTIKSEHTHKSCWEGKEQKGCSLSFIFRGQFCVKMMWKKTSEIVFYIWYTRRKSKTRHRRQRPVPSHVSWRKGRTQGKGWDCLAGLVGHKGGVLTLSLSLFLTLSLLSVSLSALQARDAGPGHTHQLHRQHISLSL